MMTNKNYSFRWLTVSALLALAVTTAEPNIAFAKKSKVQTAKVVGLSSQAKQATTTLRIKGSSTPTFTVYKLENPSRVVVDLVGASLSDKLKRDEEKVVWNVNSWAVGQVSAHTMSKSRGSLVRVVVGLSRPSRYQVKASGNDVLIEVTAKSAPVGMDPLALKRAQSARAHARLAADKELASARAEAALIRAEAAQRDRQAKKTIAEAERLMALAKERSQAAARDSRTANSEIAKAQQREKSALAAEASAEAKQVQMRRAEAKAQSAQVAAQQALAQNSNNQSSLRAKAESAAKDADSRRRQAEKAMKLAESRRQQAERATRSAEARQLDASRALHRAENERKDAEGQRSIALRSKKSAERERLSAQTAADAAAMRAQELKDLVRAEESRFATAHKLRNREEQAVSKASHAKAEALAQARVATAAQAKLAQELKSLSAAKRDAQHRRTEAERALALVRKAAADSKTSMTRKSELEKEATRLAAAQRAADKRLATQKVSLTRQRKQVAALSSKHKAAAKGLVLLEKQASMAVARRGAEEKQLAVLISKRSDMKRQLDQAHQMRLQAKAELSQARKARLAAAASRKAALDEAHAAQLAHSRANKHENAAAEKASAANLAHSRADEHESAAKASHRRMLENEKAAELARRNVLKTQSAVDAAHTRIAADEKATQRAHRAALSSKSAAAAARTRIAADEEAAQRAHRAALSSKSAAAAARTRTIANEKAAVLAQTRASKLESEAMASQARALKKEETVQRELELAKRARLAAESDRRTIAAKMQNARSQETEAKQRLLATKRARKSAEGKASASAISNAKQHELAASKALQEARKERLLAQKARREGEQALLLASQREKSASKKLADANKRRPVAKKLIAKTRLTELDVVDKQDVTRVVIAMSSPAAPVVLSNHGREAVLEIPFAAIRNEQERTLDTSSLKGAIRSVSSYRDPKNPSSLKIVVDLNGPSQGVLKKLGNTYYWEFPKAKKTLAMAPKKPRKKRPAASYKAQAVAGYGSASSPITQQTVSQLSRRRRRTYRGQKIDLDYKKSDIHDLMRLLADVGGVNIIVPDDIKARVTIRLRRVPWDQALDVILASKGLGYKLEGPGLFRIATQKELDAEYEAKLARAKVQAESEAPQPEIFNLNYVDASDVRSQLKSLLSNKGSLQVDKRTNALIVNDVRANRLRIIDMLTRLDTQTPQIQIEARIVEARSTFVRQFGIQWGGNMNASSAGGNATGLIFPSSIGLAGASDDGSTPTGGVGASPTDFAVNLPAAIGTGSGGGIGLSLGSLGGNLGLNLRLSALEDEGSVRIISSPKITTSNNSEASIKSGVSIPVSVVSANGVQTQFVPAVLELKVKPSVSLRDCAVSMDVNIKKNEADFVNTGARGDPTLLTKEAMTTLLVQDGDTSVIGGIYTRNSGVAYSKVPFLGDLPVFGWLFKTTKENDERTEVLIFITPKITNRAFLPCAE